MDRRDFLKSALASGVLYTMGGVSSLAHAEGFPELNNRVLVNLMLPGGPDFRHILPPAFSPDTDSFGYLHWQARTTSHNLSSDPQSWEDRWNDDFFSISENGTDFGILKKAGWLKSMWDSGNVALVNNMVGATTRDHSHCQQVMDQGNLTSTTSDQGRPGWGGRLAYHSGGNVVSLSTTPRKFCFGPHPSNPELNTDDVLISAANTRNMTLYHPASGQENSGGGRMARTLKSYYAAKRQELPADSIYQKFLNHEGKSRTFGNAVNARLDTTPLPDAITALHTSDDPSALNKRSFGEQIRNLHDTLLASDILQLRVASMEYGGWDSHKNQRDSIEPQWEDIFGTDRALDRLFQAIPAEIMDEVVFVIGGEFGRQLVSNGSAGTDHGRGTTILVIGNGVNGGVYGDMFPQEELSRLSDSSPDITGQTEYGHLCDWVSDGSGDQVFPDRNLASLEPGLDLSGLFT